MSTQVPAKDIKVPILGKRINLDGTISYTVPAYEIPDPQGFRLYAPDSVWNKKLSNEPIHPNSDGYIQELLENNKLAGPWINTINYSVPVYYVDGMTPKQKVYLTDQYAKGGPVDLECQKGVPVPDKVIISGGTDKHLTIIDKSANGGKGLEWDFWGLEIVKGVCYAKNAGILDNVSDSDGRMTKRPDYYWNSSTATHLPAAAGLITLDELPKGVIPHALALAIVRPKKAVCVYPAQTTDGWYDGPNAIPEGTRFRFPANVSIDPNWTHLTRMIVTAIRDYGMILRDQAGCTALFVEDPRVYGKGEEVLTPHMAGKQIWDVMAQIPWAKLQVLA